MGVLSVAMTLPAARSAQLLSRLPGGEGERQKIAIRVLRLRARVGQVDEHEQIAERVGGGDRGGCKQRRGGGR